MLNNARQAVHLTVINVQSDPSLDPTNAGLFSDRRTEIAWNDDFTAFRVVSLRWWDDASYAVYQSGLPDPNDDSWSGDTCVSCDEPSVYTEPEPLCDAHWTDRALNECF